MNDIDEWFMANYEIITDKTLKNKEIKLFCILNLLYEEEISLRKAYELCTEAGLFSDHWIGVDSQTIDVWENYYEGA